MEARRIPSTRRRPLFHDQFARIAFVGLEPLVAHRSPAIAAIEKDPDTDVERIVHWSHLRGRRSGRSHRSGRHHARLPNAFTVRGSTAHFNHELLLAVAEPGREYIGRF